MLGGLNHVAIVVPDLQRAALIYAALGARVSQPRDLPEHGVTVLFVELANTKIELMHPLGPESPVSRFLERNPQGGIHHICLDTGDLAAVSGNLEAVGVRLLGNGAPKIGAHGRPVLFANPKDTQGALVEFEQTF